MEWIELGKLANIETGKLNANAADEDGKYPFFTCADEISRINDYKYDKECILIAGNGNLNVKYYSGKFNAYQRTYIVESKDKKTLSTMYLYYFMNTYMDKLRELSIGGVIKYIKLGHLQDAKIPVPPIETQEKIVQVLDQAQALIDKRKEQIKALDQLIESIFYTMFGDPVRNEKGWDVKKLEDSIIHMNNGLQRRGKDDDGEIVLRLVELQTNYIDYSNYNRIKLEKGEREKYQIFDQDILFARVNGNPDYVGRSSVYYEKADEKVYFNDHIIRARFDLEKVNPLYITTLLNSEYGIGLFKEHIKTSAGQFTINQNGIKSLVVPLPNISIQNEFTDKVKIIEKQKDVLGESLELMEENFKSIMDKAFKGQLFN